MTTPVHPTLVAQQINEATNHVHKGVVARCQQQARTVVEKPLEVAVYHSVWYFELAGLLGQLQERKLNRFSPGEA